MSILNEQSIVKLPCGGAFQGVLKDGAPASGTGTWEGRRYQGPWKDFLPHGKGEMLFSLKDATQLQIKSPFENGIPIVKHFTASRTGNNIQLAMKIPLINFPAAAPQKNVQTSGPQTRFIFKDGAHYKGETINSQPHGVGTIIYSLENDCSVSIQTKFQKGQISSDAFKIIQKGTQRWAVAELIYSVASSAIAAANPVDMSETNSKHKSADTETELQESRSLKRKSAPKKKRNSHRSKKRRTNCEASVPSTSASVSLSPHPMNHDSECDKDRASHDEDIYEKAFMEFDFSECEEVESAAPSTTNEKSEEPCTNAASKTIGKRLISAEISTLVLKELLSHELKADEHSESWQIKLWHIQGKDALTLINKKHPAFSMRATTLSKIWNSSVGFNWPNVKMGRIATLYDTLKTYFGDEKAKSHVDGLLAAIDAIITEKLKEALEKFKSRGY
jgi:hypothetical protein